MYYRYKTYVLVYGHDNLIGIAVDFLYKAVFELNPIPFVVL